MDGNKIIEGLLERIKNLVMENTMLAIKVQELEERPNEEGTE